METLPAHFGGSFSDGGVNSNLTLRPGEVQAAYYPSDPQNLSKRVIEYSVLVQHRSGTTVVSRMYHNCFVTDLFGGMADTLTFTLRPDTSASTMTAKKRGPVGKGSRVLLLCVNGEEHSAAIIGGLQHPNNPKAVKPDSGDFADSIGLHFRFNGIDISINHDGELTLEYQGAMNADATIADGVDQGALGTTVKVTKDGNFSVADKDNKNVILLDHATGKVQVTSQNEVDVSAPKVRLGSEDADEPFVMGNQWRQMMTELLDGISQLTVTNSAGPSGPPNNLAVFQKIKATLQRQLSSVVFGE